ncbi:MAG TPA: serine hydrolase domain-containing protein [Candidatus Saccharimonadales bacterium]|nr:serine hydrolase domain-containing protein [Candidatus Saccharimonadales bacterium]
MNKHACSQAITFIDSWLEYQSRQMDVPGFVVAIQHGKETPLLRAYGLANVERCEPMTVQHQFGVASLSKMFTATAIMLLAERGMVGLDDQATIYLPWLAEHTDSRVRAITVRHLLRHGAGMLRDGCDSDFWQLRRPFPDKQELRREIMNAALVSKPGGKLKYSNLGYALLGQIVEVGSGQTYNQFVAKEIIEPLGLAHTTPEYTPRFNSQLATGYTRPFDRQRFPVPKAIHTQAFTPLFGWHTTAQDLCRFITSQFPSQDTIISVEAKKALHIGHRHHWVLPEDRGTDYGLGFITYQLGHRRVTGHGGVYVGHRSCVYADLNNELAVVILANTRDAPVPEMMQGIFSVFDYFERWGAQPTPPERARFNARLMSFWATFQIVATHDRIISILPEQWLPFADPEELELIDSHRLKIIKTSDMASEGEIIRYVFQNEKVVSAKYAGTTMLPEPVYTEELRASAKRWLASS